jgi:hypothetical protein
VSSSGQPDHRPKKPRVKCTGRDLKELRREIPKQPVSHLFIVIILNQFRMTATDAEIREIKGLIEISPETPAKQDTIGVPPNEQVRRFSILKNSLVRQNN